MIIGILAVIAAPRLFGTAGRANGGATRQSLSVVRKAIETFAAVPDPATVMLMVFATGGCVLRLRATRDQLSGVELRDDLFRRVLLRLWHRDALLQLHPPPDFRQVVDSFEGGSSIPGRAIPSSPAAAGAAK
jgi:hypothetical protein